MIYENMDLVNHSKEHIVKTLRKRMDKKLKKEKIPREETFDKDMDEFIRIYNRYDGYIIKNPTWEELEIDFKLYFLLENKKRILSRESISDICRKKKM